MTAAEQLEARVAELERRVDELRADVRALPTGPIVEARLEVLLARIDGLRGEVTELRRRIEADIDDLERETRQLWNIGHEHRKQIIAVAVAVIAPIVVGVVLWVITSGVLIP